MEEYRDRISRREFIERTGIAAAGLMAGGLFAEAEAKTIDSPSRHKRTRPNRRSTDYIILHTTEGGATGSLNRLKRGGFVHYMIDRNGDVYSIMGLYQWAGGMQRSMWNNKRNLNNSSVQIEFVGYHHRDLTADQYSSGRGLISELKHVFPWVQDDHIMPHSQVAYGIPNEHHDRSHRGSRKCGMLLATDAVRVRLGLSSKPKYDPDVAAGRLVIADADLAEVLYGKVSPFKSAAPNRNHAENGEVFHTIERGQTAWAYAGSEFASPATVYFLNDGRVRTGSELKMGGFDFNVIEPGTTVAVGYVYGGHISRSRSAYDICGREWSLPTTIYRLPNGDIKSGEEINPGRLPAGTLVLFKE